MDALPTQFLESYPFPVFAVPLPVRGPDADTHATNINLDINGPRTAQQILQPGLALPSPPLTPGAAELLDQVVWANAHWKRAARGTPLSRCLDTNAARALTTWLECVADGHAVAEAYREEEEADADYRADSPTETTTTTTWVDNLDEYACDCTSDDGRGGAGARGGQGGVEQAPGVFDLRTREGVRRWAASVGASSKSDESDDYDHGDFDETCPHGACGSGAKRERRREPFCTIALDFSFPARTLRFELAATVVSTLPHGHRGCLHTCNTSCGSCVTADRNTTPLAVITTLPRRQPRPMPYRDSDVGRDCGPKRTQNGCTIQRLGAPSGPISLPERRGSAGGELLNAVDLKSEAGGVGPSLRSFPSFRIDRDGISCGRAGETITSGSRGQPVSAVSCPTTINKTATLHPTVNAGGRHAEYNGERFLVGGEYTPGHPIFIDGDGVIRAAPDEVEPRDKTSSDPLSVTNLLQSYDWSETPLGPRDDWPISLRAIASMMTVFPLGTALWWGKDLTFIYNHEYSQTITHHPALYGTFGAQSMQNLRSSLGPLTNALLSGSSIYKDDEFYLRRHPDGQVCEAYRSLLWAPIKNEEGHYGGIWHAVRETTPKVLGDRRLGLLRELSDSTSRARTLHDLERGVLETLLAHPKDAPFAMLYFVDDKRPKESLQSNEPRMVRLRYAGGVGVPSEHPSAPELVSVPMPVAEQDGPSQTPISAANSPWPGEASLPEVTSAREKQPPSEPGTSPTWSHASTFESASTRLDPGWHLANVLASRRPMLVDCEELVSDYPVRAWDDLPTEAVVMPIMLASEDGLPGAILVLGLSSRLKFDAQYERFIEDLRFQIASYLSAIRSYDADERRIGNLATLERAKSILFSNVSHELLGPLTLVSGPIDDAISDLPEGSSRREVLLMAHRNVGRLSRLVTMLVDISNVDSGPPEGSFCRVNLGVLTRDVATMFRKAATRTNLTYSIVCDEKPRNVYVDRERWEKILFVLIENALKYTREGFVRVTLEYQHQQAVLTVADSGVGISSANVEELNFGLFPHPNLHASSTMPPTRLPGPKSTRGSSISLMLACKLVQLHHGELEIESHTAAETADGSHGSVFRVRLPLGAAHLPTQAIGPPLDSRSIASEQAQFSASNQMGREMVEEAKFWHRDNKDDTDATSISASSSQETRRSRGIDGNLLYFTSTDVIMVVDDMPDAQRYMRSIFEPYCKVVVAHNGLDALTKHDQCMPDLIISDVMLPDMNGLELLDALRSGSKEQKLVPVILLGAPGDTRTTCVLRADDYLAKPFNTRELIMRANMQLKMGKERRTLERLFDERTHELRLLTEHSPAGILRCDEQGVVLYANQAWHDMTGVPHDAYDIAPTYTDPSCGQELMEKWMNFVVSDDLVLGMETLWKNGRWIFCQHARLNKSLVGKGGYIGTTIDVTERKLNDELSRQRISEAEAQRAEAEEARSQQELLIDITSHEIRNPISSILQCSSMVRSNLMVLQEQLNESLDTGHKFQPTRQLLLSVAEDLEALDSIYQCGLAQERISNDVLSLGKMQLDVLHMFDVETLIPKVAKQVVSIFQNEARMNRITLNLRVSAAFKELGIGPVLTDPVRLSQIVTNLLSNAIRFTANSKERRIELHVDVGLNPPLEKTCVKPPRGESGPAPDPTDDSSAPAGSPVYIYMSVSDTGPGLTPTELSKLFQRFAQASPMTHTVFGGSGLGLFVCRKLAERMGGQIDVTSEYGKGSQFHFYIRATCPKLQVKSDGVDGTLGDGALRKTHPRLFKSRSRSPSPVAVPPPPCPLGQPTVVKKLRILVVEDNLINRKVLLRQLKHVGIETDSAANGLEGVNKVKTVMGINKEKTDGSELYDCILMDLEMPVMDGYTAARTIRAAEAEGSLHKSLIIALTGNARQVQIREGMADFDAAVTKPYRLDDLLRTVHSHIDSQEAEKEKEKEKREEHDRRGEIDEDGGDEDGGVGTGGEGAGGAAVSV